jgi:hypothetical protein
MVLSSVLAVGAGCTEKNPLYAGPAGGGERAPSDVTTEGPDQTERRITDAAGEDAVGGPGGTADAALDASGAEALPADGPFGGDTASPATVDSGAAPLPGTGLRGDYFDGTMLESGTTGSLDLTRLDETVDFDWGTGRASGSVDDDYFSVRWSGQVMPRYSESYTFTTVTDEGVRLWVDGVQLINQWVDQQSVAHSGTITLVANRRYDLRMEYYERTGRASARLYWSSASQANEIIPRTHLFPP